MGATSELSLAAKTPSWEVKLTLPSGDFDALPSKEASIDGPGAGSDQCKGGTEGAQQQVGPQIYRPRYCMPKLNECHKGPRDRRP